MHARRFHTRFCVVLAAVCAFSAATRLAAAPSPPLGEGVKSATIHRDDGKGQPGERITQITPKDRVIHFRVEMERHHDGPVVAKWVFVSVDSAGKTTQFGENTLRGDGYTKINGTLTGNADWPVGKYHTDLHVNDKLLQGFDYECAPPAPAR